VLPLAVVALPPGLVYFMLDSTFHILEVTWDLLIFMLLFFLESGSRLHGAGSPLSASFFLRFLLLLGFIRLGLLLIELGRGVLGNKTLIIMEIRFSILFIFCFSLLLLLLLLVIVCLSWRRRIARISYLCYYFRNLWLLFSFRSLVEEFIEI